VKFRPEQNRFVPLPVDLGPASDRIVLVLYGTGIRFHNSLSAAIVTIGGAYAEVLFAEAEPDSVGLDRVEVCRAAKSGRPRGSKRFVDRGRADLKSSADQRTVIRCNAHPATIYRVAAAYPGARSKCTNRLIQN
jgi:hypothetical protein